MAAGTPNQIQVDPNLGTSGQERRELERFNPRLDGFGTVHMASTRIGTWVKFEDAQARIEELERERDGCDRREQRAWEKASAAELPTPVAA